MKHKQHYSQAPGACVFMGRVLHFKRYHWGLKKNCESNYFWKTTYINCYKDQPPYEGFSVSPKVRMKLLGWYWSSLIQTLLHLTCNSCWLNAQKGRKPNSFVQQAGTYTRALDQRYCNGYTLTLGDTEKPSQVDEVCNSQHNFLLRKSFTFAVGFSSRLQWFWWVEGKRQISPL